MNNNITNSKFHKFEACALFYEWCSYEQHHSGFLYYESWFEVDALFSVWLMFFFMSFAY